MQGISIFGGKQFLINLDMACYFKKLIITIVFDGCNLFYIGETGTILRARFRVHTHQIRDPKNRKIKLSEHIDLCGQFKE